MKRAIMTDARMPPMAPPMAPAMAPFLGDSASQYLLNSSQLSLFCIFLYWMKVLLMIVIDKGFYSKFNLIQPIKFD